LILHSFRFVGLSFLVPGVVAADLPAAFAQSAAYGDIIAAVLALLSLLLLLFPRRGAGYPMVWAFDPWGSGGLLDGFSQANAAGLVPGRLGATYFIPTGVVPLLLITHGLSFRILRRSQDDTSLSAETGMRA